MALLQPNLTPSRKDLRWFAALWWPAMCGAIGMMFVRKFHAPITGIGVCAGGGLLAVLGIMAPSVIRPVYIGLIRLTYPIGWCVSHGRNMTFPVSLPPEEQQHNLPAITHVHGNRRLQTVFREQSRT